jgi:hypothetical protein
MSVASIEQLIGVVFLSHQSTEFQRLRSRCPLSDEVTDAAVMVRLEAVVGELEVSLGVLQWIARKAIENMDLVEF